MLSEKVRMLEKENEHLKGEIGGQACCIKLTKKCLKGI